MPATALASEAPQITSLFPLSGKQQLSKSRSFAITEVYDMLLHAVYAYHLVAAEQLCRRYYEAGMITTVKDRLKDLVTHGYLDYLQLRTAKGSGPYIYFLAAKGRSYFTRAGCDLKGYYRPSKEKERSYFHLMHALELNDQLIQAARFAETEAGFSLPEMRHDFTLRRKPLRVAIKRRVDGGMKEETDEIVADAWLEFHTPYKQARRWIWWEHDRGEASVTKVKTHLRGILAFIKDEGYKQEFGASGMTVVYTTSAGEHRREKLREWTRDILMEQKQSLQADASNTTFSEEAKETSHAVSFGNWFLFTAVPPFRSVPPTHNELFLSNVWYHPFGNKPTAMFRQT